MKIAFRLALSSRIFIISRRLCGCIAIDYCVPSTVPPIRIPMGDPASGFLTALSGTYKVVEFVFQLSNVRAEMHIVHQQLELLEGNLRELKTLSADKRITLDQDRRERINRLIYNTLKYINVVAKPVERRRVERQVNGTVCLFHRITWVLRDKGTVEQNRPLLPIYQADIIKEIAELSAMLREATRRGEDRSRPGEDELNHLTVHKKSMLDLITTSVMR